MPENKNQIFKKKIFIFQGQIQTKPSVNLRRSLPSTPSEDVNTWSKFNLSKELEEVRKQLKIKDQEILQLRAQIATLPEKSFKSSLQIAERSKTSSISFEENKVT